MEQKDIKDMPSCMGLQAFVPASLSIALTIAEGGLVSIIDGKPVLDYGACLRVL